MQPDDQNRIYYEPRCHEGNYGLPALLDRRARGREGVRGRTRSGSGVAGHRQLPSGAGVGGPQSMRSWFERFVDRDRFSPRRPRERRDFDFGDTQLPARPASRRAPQTASRISTASGRRSTRPLGSAGARRARGHGDAEGVYDYEYARVPAAPVVALGAAAGVPALARRRAGRRSDSLQAGSAADQAGEQRELDRSRSRAQVLSAGHSARDVHAVSVRDRAGHRQDSHDVRVLERGARDPHEQGRGPSRRYATWATRSATGKAIRSSSR